MAKDHPKCKFCAASASYIAAQSVNQGRTVRWVLVCAQHVVGWNYGGDWVAPIYKLFRVKREP